MRVARGKVVGNTVVLEGEPLPGGIDGFELDEQSQHTLMEADAAIDRGEGISAEELFKRIGLIVSNSSR
ncbi:MAG: hypothetical protein JNM17_33210 [Archangium sp.]|nr:hypothetical protein [Archangium sp.]